MTPQCIRPALTSPLRYYALSTETIFLVRVSRVTYSKTCPSLFVLFVLVFDFDLLLLFTKKLRFIEENVPHSLSEAC